MDKVAPLSAAFIHVGLLHIALNMYVFWGAGTLAERLDGTSPTSCSIWSPPWAARS